MVNDPCWKIKNYKIYAKFYDLCLWKYLFFCDRLYGFSVEDLEQFVILEGLADWRTLHEEISILGNSET